VHELAALVKQGGLVLADSLEQSLVLGDAASAVDLLLQSGLVERRTSRAGDLIAYPESSREALAYYRATIAPALAIPAVLALVLQAEAPAPAASIVENASQWLRLLRFEYFPPPVEERRRRLDEALDHFAKRGWIERDGPSVRIRREGLPWLAFLSAQIRPVLENYRAYLSALREGALPKPQERVTQEAAAALEDHLLLAQARHSEAVCSTTSANALQALIEEEIVVADGNPRRPRTQLDRGARWGALEEWLSRLARVLEPGALAGAEPRQGRPGSA
jgi:glycerol-3-phosphate O-acyltransferase